jgi:hypothetical protein
VTPAFARDCLARIELGLDRCGWPYSARLSRWIDALVVLSEQKDAGA